MRGGWSFGVLSGFALAACSETAPAPAPEPEPSFTTADLQDAGKCQKCHPDHYREWSGSMHAYASQDPVFVAMNARGQRETNGALGDFCVKCHAPMAVRTGATKDGLNLATLPAELQGVTCYFCHSAEKVTDTHDNPIELATDGVMRGGITDPVPNEAHRAGYSKLLDRTQADSAAACGSCHDIVNPKGAHLERTFAEWKETLFAHESTQLTCSGCHMEGRDGVAADAPGVGARRVHSHAFPAVDVALGDFAEADAQRAAVQKELDTTLQAAVCVKGVGFDGLATIQVVLDNVAAGHRWPSGATQDRRAWVELTAYKGADVLYQSGVTAEGQSVTDLADPDLWLMRDCIFDEDKQPVHMFWEAATSDGNLLPGSTTNDPTKPEYYQTHVYRTFPRPTSTPQTLAVAPDRVTMRVRLIPVGLDVLDSLVQSGDLDPSVKAAMPIFTLASTDLEWTVEKATVQYTEQGLPVACVTSGLSAGGAGAFPAPEHESCSP